MKLRCKDLYELSKAAKAIIAFAENAKIWLFYGEMGAGKTTLISALCKELGVAGTTSSPTFSIVNEYIGNSETIYHFDFYRLKTEEEAYDMGYEEYFESGHLCLVEWPDKISSLLPECGVLTVRINPEKDLSRNIELSKIL